MKWAKGNPTELGLCGKMDYRHSYAYVLEHLQALPDLHLLRRRAGGC